MFPGIILLQMKAIIGRKIGMTRIYNEAGNALPVTLVLAEPNVITQVKTLKKDGYNAVQIAIPEEKKINKPQAGHLAKAKIKSRILKEFGLSGENQVGNKINLSSFKKGDVVNVTSISKGKGFAGTVKRHHFHLGPKTHGSDNYRRPGSIGSMYPQRVIKGRRMAGHLGNQKKTVKNLKIADINLENHILMLNGAVPGPNKGTLYLWSKE